MQACARTMYMHAYAHGTCTHAPAQCSCMCTYAHARTRLHMAPTLVQTHAHLFWLRANRLRPYSSAVSCVSEDLISLWLFGLACIALAWPRLRWQRWWLRLNGLAGRCQWERWCSLEPPAGRAMPCIKLLPLPPPSGSHWPVGGFQQCGVCVLSCCCSLSVAPCFFVLAWYWFLLQFLCRMSLNDHPTAPLLEQGR